MQDSIYQFVRIYYPFNLMHPSCFFSHPDFNATTNRSVFLHNSLHTQGLSFSIPGIVKIEPQGHRVCFTQQDKMVSKLIKPTNSPTTVYELYSNVPHLASSTLACTVLLICQSIRLKWYLTTALACIFMTVKEIDILK